MNIRIAKYNDLERIVEIYNQAILTKKSTGDVNTVTVEERQNWFYKHTPEKYPLYVYEINMETVAWLSFSPYRLGRNAFDRTAEISCYVHNEYFRRGIAGELIIYAINKCRDLNIDNLVAYILAHNEASIKLMEKMGFEKWGFLPKVAEFSYTKFNHVIYGINLI